MQVNARLKFLRMAPRKVRLVINLVRGLPVHAALEQLVFCNKEAARPVAKLIKSAMANAEHNFQLDASKLRIAKITADGGPTLHRWRARAHGSAAPIRKRTSHITLILSDETPAQVHASQRKVEKKLSKKSKTPADASVAKKAPVKAKVGSKRPKKERAGNTSSSNA